MAGGNSLGFFDLGSVPKIMHEAIGPPARADARVFGLKPQRLAADAAYGSGLMIGWLMRRGIEPHIPLLDRERQTNGFFTRADFTFDPQANVFICPGALLHGSTAGRSQPPAATFMGGERTPAARVRACGSAWR